MSRAERLLQLMQVLRRYRAPVSGAALAAELSVSVRTLYRDVASLQAQGADIAGEPGVGYVLRPGFLLPPLMFSQDEIEALALGSRWVASQTDTPLAQAAHNALAKIAAVLPGDLRLDMDTSALLIGPAPAADAVALGQAQAQIRLAIRNERKLDLQYRDAQGRSTRRVVWPFALGFFEQVRVLVAWCEQRDAVRHFRLDRIAKLTTQEQRYPQRRQALLKAWRQEQGIQAP